MQCAALDPAAEERFNVFFAKSPRKVWNVGSSLIGSPFHGSSQGTVAREREGVGCVTKAISDYALARPGSSDLEQPEPSPYYRAAALRYKPWAEFLNLSQLKYVAGGG